MMSPDSLPPDWQDVLHEQFCQPYFLQLQDFIQQERAQHRVYPPAHQTFAALEHTPFQQVRVLLLGQDPYHGEGQAHGLSFSVLPGTPPPPSLKNIFKERQSDLGLSPPDHGYLGAWAAQGVLMLNTVLTVRAGEAGSHQKRGWERFTDSIIQALSQRSEPLVFVLWGKQAQTRRALINEHRHHVIASAHPSPLSAHRGFFGSRPFSSINRILPTPPIDWQLPPLDAVNKQ